MSEASDSEISDITEINSDDELPSDSVGDCSVISVKGVLKEIISCGTGYEKPSIGDEIIIEFESLQNTDPSSDNTNCLRTPPENGRLKLILGGHSKEDYDSTGKREIPWGVEMALRKMLKGERSKILIKKGSLFSKPRNQNGKTLENSILQVDYKNYNNRSRKLINLIKKESEEFDAFIITLYDFFHIDLICEGVGKKVWRKGATLKSPRKKDTVGLLVSQLKFERVLDNFAISPEIGDITSGLEWEKLSLSLDNPSELQESVSRICGENTIPVCDFVSCITSMRLGEISEFRFNYSKSRSSNLLICLTGLFWEKSIQIKPPFNKDIKNKTVTLSSFEGETLCQASPTAEGGRLLTKRISSLNLEYNTRLEIRLENLALVDHKGQGRRVEMSLPLKSTENLKSVTLQITPGFYNLPVWLEQSIVYCFLGGKYHLKVPLSIFLLLPPSQALVDSKSEIQEKTNSVIIHPSNCTSTSDINANCNSVGKLHAIWEAGKFIKELESLGYNMSEDVEENCSAMMELDLSICTLDVVENYIPFCQSTAEKEFEYYYYLGNVMSSYSDLVYKSTWSMLALDIFDKFLFAATLLPFYSKLFDYKKYASSANWNLVRKENVHNAVNSKPKYDQTQKLTVLKCDSLSEGCEKDQTTDFVLVSQDLIDCLGREERESLRSLINVINIILRTYFETRQYEKYYNVLGKYKFLTEFKPSHSSPSRLSASKNGDNLSCGVNCEEL
ncbi:hypothetical protein OIY81_1791 [Cryptosporidium canis]|nr:hypothetical protein OIY81_1791 [Cryptosporidium canis]